MDTGSITGKFQEFLFLSKFFNREESFTAKHKKTKPFGNPTNKESRNANRMIKGINKRFPPIFDFNYAKKREIARKHGVRVSKLFK